jgi:hypothetical protein
MRTGSARIADLYRSDLDRHLFALEPRNTSAPRPGPAGRAAGWLRTALALAAWLVMGGR